MNYIVRIFGFYFENYKHSDRVLEYNVIDTGNRFKLVRVPIDLEQAAYKEAESPTDLGNNFKSLEEAVVAVLKDLRKKEIDLGLYPEIKNSQDLVPYKQKAEELVYRIQNLKMTQITIYGNLKKYPPASVETEAVYKKWREILYKLHGTKPEYNGIDEISFEEFIRKEIASING